MQNAELKRDPVEIVGKYYERGSLAYEILVAHGAMVAEKALFLAGRTKGHIADMAFIREAAMLHDIGIFMTDAPEIGCFGKSPYICHGYLGREILEKEGLFRHALVCERHVGVGISISDIRKWHLPLPEREMTPLTPEEKIICFADKFFSKGKKYGNREKPIEVIRSGLARYGEEKLSRFDEWMDLFGV